MALSPSSIKIYQKCPKQFEAKYIKKSLPYKQSAAAARGEKLHELMELAINYGWDNIDWPDVNNYHHAKGFVQSVKALEDSGWTIYTEAETAISKNGLTYEWNDKTAYIKSRIDCYAVNPDFDYALIFDWKTGKHYEEDKVQLIINAMCLKSYTHKSIYHCAFCYLDDGECVKVDCNVPEGCYFN